MFLYFLRTTQLPHIKFFADVLSITYSMGYFTKKTSYKLCIDAFCITGPNLSIFLHVFRNLKHYFDIFPKVLILCGRH